MRIGFGTDYHILQTGLPLYLGGIRIPAEKGCLAHSDGDVLLHAICDALLGAFALGDIGQMFPNTDTRYKNISSLILLERTYGYIKNKGYKVTNIDTMLILESPKLSPYILQMRKAIAPVLEIQTDRISIKATTAEGLGFVGREEGITAQAIVLLYEAVKV